MKLKMKFDKKAVLGILVQYGERAVFACVVLCFLLFVYKSFTRESYTKTPQDLKAAASNAIKTIERTVPQPIAKDGETILETIKRISGHIKEGPYATAIPFNPPIFAPKTKRGMPKLYSVESLRGTPGVGCFGGQAGMARGMGGMGGPGMGGMAGGRNMRGDEDAEPIGKRWVMLTGIVNLDKQIEAYLDCFKDAVWKNSRTDRMPIYCGFKVERAEVTDSQSEETLQWEQPYSSLSKERMKCGGTGAMGTNRTLIAPNFTTYQSFAPYPTLTFPLPSLLERDWGEEIAHPPEIPLLNFEDTMNSRFRKPGEEKAEEQETDEDDFGVDMRRGMGRGMGMGGPGMGMGMEGGMGGPGMGMGMEGGMGGPGMGMGMQGGRFARGGMGQRGMIQQEISPYILFRFIDLNVEPGKQYRYRVMIALLNPNYEVEPRFLSPDLQQIIAEDKQLKKKKWKKFIKSEWSKPSEVIVVPRDDQLLLAEVIPSTRSEPKAKIMAVHWDHKNGVEVSDNFEDIRRGNVANFLDHEVKPKLAQNQPGRGMGPGMGMEGGMEGMMGPGMGMEGGMGRDDGRRAKKKKPKRTKNKGRKTDDREGMMGGPGGPGMGMGFGRPNRLPKKVDFKSECLVLDLRGGQRLPGKNRINGPGEILLLDPDGNLVVQNDVTDFDKIKDQTYPPRPKSGFGGGRGMEGMMGPGMGMEGGMEGGMMGPGMGGPGMGGPGMGGPGMGGP